MQTPLTNIKVAKSILGMKVYEIDFDPNMSSVKRYAAIHVLKNAIKHLSKVKDKK